MNHELESYAVVWFFACLAIAAAAALAFVIERLAARYYARRDRFAPAIVELRSENGNHRLQTIEQTPARPMTRADHLQIESEREPAQVQADFRRDIPSDPATGLRFHPHMTLLAASRIAGERGFILSIEWSKLGGMKVTTRPRPAPHFLTQGKRHEI